MSLKVLPYGGVGDDMFGELGGVQIMFYDEERNTKFMLDIGQRPDHINDYYGFPYKASKYRVLPISMFLGSYPPIEGMYRHDYLERLGKKAGELPLDGILLTHEHFDHIGGLSLIRHDMPVYVNELSLLQMYIWQYISGGRINEFVDMYESFSLGKSVTGAEKFLKGDEAMIPRNIKRYTPEVPFKIGNLDFMAYSVDHSVPGACGFIVDTSVGKIGISGDIRYRGRRPEDTRKFFKECIDQKVKYMFMEGSLLHFPHSGTEEDVSDAVARETRNSALATISYPVRDFDRLTSLYNAAKANKRMLTIGMDQALYLKAYDGLNGFPRLNWKYIGVFVPPMGAGILDDERFPPMLAQNDYRYWQRPFLEKNRWDDNESKIQRVSIEDIKNNQDSFLVTIPGNASKMLDLFEQIRPRPGSMYIRSNPQGWTTSMEVEDEKKRNVLEDFGMHARGSQVPDYFEPSVIHDILQIHVTGHMNSEEVTNTINMFDPSVTTIVPYHTLQLGLYTDIIKNKNYIVPVRGNVMELK